MCDDRDRLLDYMYDECDADERRRVDAHLAECAECREEIGSLRRARQDLLAWDVPDHGSVWKPFVPARVVPSWRDIPAWALAAAAGVMFAIGAAGGVVTHAFLSHEGAAVQTAVLSAQTPAAVMPVRDGVTEAQLTSLEQRLLQTMRSELASRVQLVSAHAASERVLASASDAITSRLEDLVNQSQAHEQLIIGLNKNLVQVSERANSRLSGLERQIEGLRQAQQQQIGGSK